MCYTNALITHLWYRFCMSTKLLSLLLCIMFSASLITTAYGSYVIGSTKTLTLLSLDELPECINAVQCDATFLAGDSVTFTGLLLDADENFIRDAKVNIYRVEGMEMHLLTSAVTERDGTFKATWNATFMGKKFAGETFKKQIDELSTVFARFEGDDKYATSQSNKMVMTVKVMDVTTHVATDKKVYQEGESALIFINFIETGTSGEKIRYGNFVSPDTIRAAFDQEAVELSEKKEGSYTFVTPPLTIGHHQLVINPAKEGYNTSAGFITVQVSGFLWK